MVKNLIAQSQKILSRQQSSILTAAIVITGSSFLSAILGLIRNRLLVTYFFGTTELQQQLDAYWVAFRLPELVFQLLVIGSLSAAFIPVFSSYYKKNRQEAYDIASSVMNLVLGVFFVLSLIIFIFAENLNSVITSQNFSPEQVILAAQLSRIMLIAQLFFAISNFLTGMIQAQQRFLIPALSPLMYNLGIIAGIMVLSPLLGIYGPAIGVVIGAFFHLALQIPLAFQLGYRYRPILKFNHPGVREMVRLMLPRTMAISANQIELFASVYFATALSAGSLTIINLAQQLMSAPTRIFSVPLGQASLPFLSEQVAAQKMARFEQTLRSTLEHILFLAFPAGMLLLILRIPLVRLAYGSSDFPWPATLLTGKAVAILSLSLFAQGGIHILVRAFYALHNTTIPFATAIISVLVNIFISYLSVFVYNWGVLGLASALTISTLVQFLILSLLLFRRLSLNWNQLGFAAARIMTATGFMGLFLWLPMRFLDRFVFDTTRTIPLIGLTFVTCIIGGAVYLGLAYFLRIPEFNAYASLFKKIGNWREVLSLSQEVIEEPPTQGEEINPL